MAQRAAQERCEVIESVAMAVGMEVGQPSDIVAVPVMVDGRQFAVVSLEMSARTEAKQRAALQVLTWGISWLELLARDWRQRGKKSAAGDGTTGESRLSKSGRPEARIKRGSRRRAAGA